MTEVCDKARPLAGSREHKLTVNTQPDPVLVTGDRPSLRRLLWILLDNAIKYTPPGGRIEVSLQLTTEDSRLRVRDSGMGIPKAAIPRIFDRFYRVDASRSQEEGTGLGLAIAKWIADIHQAVLVVESAEHEGTLFEIKFPRRAASSPAGEGL